MPSAVARATTVSVALRQTRAIRRHPSAGQGSASWTRSVREPRAAVPRSRRRVQLSCQRQRDRHAATRPGPRDWASADRPRRRAEAPRLIGGRPALVVRSCRRCRCQQPFRRLPSSARSRRQQRAVCVPPAEFARSPAGAQSTGPTVGDCFAIVALAPYPSRPSRQGLSRTRRRRRTRTRVLARRPDRSGPAGAVLTGPPDPAARCP